MSLISAIFCKRASCGRALCKHANRERIKRERASTVRGYVYFTTNIPFFTN